MVDALPLFVAIPLAGAFIAALPLKKPTWWPDLLGNGIMTILGAMAAIAIGCEGTYVMGDWGRVGIELRLDGLAQIMLLAINIIGLCATLFSVAYMRSYTGRRLYYALFLLMVAGMNGVVLTGDLFNLYVFMEIAAVSSYALVAFGCQHEELEAAFKYAVLGTVASALILIGIALLYGLTGNLNMAAVAGQLQGQEGTGPALALGLLLCGFALKAALVPFHAWLPDAHPSAPAPVSAMLSGVVIKALGMYVICRIVFNVFGASSDILAAIRILGAVSMVAGVLLAIGQWDMKRLFAYHSISQIGYVALAIGLGTPLGLAGGLFHMLNHSVFKSLLFLNAGAVEHETGTRSLRVLGGLRRDMPVTTGTSLVASMSIAGIPPFNGFWSKLLIVLACVEAGSPILALTAVVVSLITLASFLKVQLYAFFQDSRASLGELKESPLTMRVAMLFLAGLCGVTSLAVLGGLRSPWLIDAAVASLWNGPFGP